jgi:DNA helicase-2/ATP-dependent DNA helicase PcrA
VLRDHRDVAEQLSRTYRYIMVDEYQDTNRLQAEIVRTLAATHDNVMAVGDDSQSIYSFRGANFRNIMDFEKMFPGTRLVKLEENYRSTRPILELANAIIDRAPEKYTKVLRARSTGDGKPMLVQCGDERAQSRFVAQRILELREEGVSLDDVAVLFRSSFHSFDLELELQKRDIPFVKRAGFKFIETAHIKDVLAHLRVVANPRDAVSWHRILLLLDGLGPKTATEIFNHVAPAADLAGAVELLRATPRRGAYTKELARLADVLDEVASDNVPVADKVAAVVGFYVPMMRHLHPEDHPKREKDLEHFLTIAAPLTGASAPSCPTWRSSRRPTASATSSRRSWTKGCSRSSTIHSAKGLEWRAVFVIGLVDGRFPSLFNIRDQDDVEEERRLLYVAVTRAKEHLYLSYPIDIYDRSTGMVLGKPSRFVEGLPEPLLPAYKSSKRTSNGSEIPSNHHLERVLLGSMTRIPVRRWLVCGAMLLALAGAFTSTARADWDDRPEPGEFEESLNPYGYWVDAPVTAASGARTRTGTGAPTSTDSGSGTSYGGPGRRPSPGAGRSTTGAGDGRTRTVGSGRRATRGAGMGRLVLGRRLRRLGAAGAGQASS